jgi:hypothetical protein
MANEHGPTHARRSSQPVLAAVRRFKPGRA